MYVSEKLLPEYLQFIDVHLSLRILDFHISKADNTTKKEELIKFKKTQILKTKLFSQIYLFLEENPTLKSDEELQALKESENKLVSYEETLKDKIIGFLNIVNNIKNDPSFDFTTPINKKIVNLKLFVEK